MSPPPMHCEKCWGDASVAALGDTSKTQTEHYREIVEARNMGERGGLVGCIEAEAALEAEKKLFGFPVVKSDEVPKLSEAGDVHFADWSDYLRRRKKP